MIHLTPSAAQELYLELAGRDLVLTIQVIGGGCSGMQHKLTWTEQTPSGYKEYELEGIKVAIEPKSALFLKGLLLDYEGGLNGKGFKFINPNAKKTCGCGISFSV